MKVLQNYISKAVIGATLVVLLVLLGMQTFIQLAAELQDIGTKNYGLVQALVYVPLLLPSKFYQFFPVAALIGSLMGLGRLASCSELIVMCAAGVSKLQITWAVVKTAFIMLLFVILVGEWLAPYATFYADHYKGQAISAEQTLQTRHGTWLRDGHDFLQINTVTSQGKLNDINRYQFDDQHRLVRASHALSGQKEDQRWLFSDVKESLFLNNSIKLHYFDRQIWPLKLNSALIGLGGINADQQTLIKLYDYIKFRRHIGLNTKQYEFAFWQRIFQPLAVLVMICLAIPFIFGPLRSTSMGLRIVIGVIFGFTFYILNAFFGPISMVYHIPPLLAALAPTLLFALIGIYLLYANR